MATGDDDRVVAMMVAERGASSWPTADVIGTRRAARGFLIYWRDGGDNDRTIAARVTDGKRPHPPLRHCLAPHPPLAESRPLPLAYRAPCAAAQCHRRQRQLSMRAAALPASRGGASAVKRPAPSPCIIVRVVSRASGGRGQSGTSSSGGELPRRQRGRPPLAGRGAAEQQQRQQQRGTRSASGKGIGRGAGGERGGESGRSSRTRQPQQQDEGALPAGKVTTPAWETERLASHTCKCAHISNDVSQYCQ